MKGASQTIVLMLLSSSTLASPLNFNSTGVSETGTWDWKNKGYIIGGGDGEYGELILKGSSSYNHSFNVALMAVMVR